MELCPRIDLAQSRALPSAARPLPPPQKHSFGWKVWQVLKTIQARLRFFVLLAAVGGVILYWDTLNAVYEKWTRPAVAQETADADSEYWCSDAPHRRPRPPGQVPHLRHAAVQAQEEHGRSRRPCRPASSAASSSRPTASPWPASARSRWSTAPLTKEIEAAGFVEFDETQADAHHEPHQRPQPHRQALRQRHRPDGRRGRPAGAALQPRPRHHHAEPARRPPRAATRTWSR